MVFPFDADLVLILPPSTSLSTSFLDAHSCPIYIITSRMTVVTWLFFFLEFFYWSCFFNPLSISSRKCFDIRWES